MANKRKLKKNINSLTGELLNECFAFSYFHPDTNSKEVTETMWALAHTRNELISRINQNTPRSENNRLSVRTFYKNVKSDMSKMPDLINHFIKN